MTTSTSTTQQLHCNDAFRLLHSQRLHAQEACELHDATLASLQLELASIQRQIEQTIQKRAEAEATREQVEEELEALKERVGWREGELSRDLLISVFRGVERRGRETVAVACKWFNEVSEGGMRVRRD